MVKVLNRINTPTGLPSWGSLLAQVFFPALAILHFFNVFFFSGFDQISGTRGDARFVLSIFEHWHQVLSGNAEWRSPVFFYPVQDALAFSDGLFATGVFHHIFRSVGFDPFLSFQLTLICVLLVGYVGINWLCRRFLELPPTLAAACGAICISLNGLSFQAVHAQLIMFTWLPLFVGLVAAWLESESPKRLVWLAAALTMFAVLLFTAFYAAWFLFYSLIVAGFLTLGWSLYIGQFNFGALLQYCRTRAIDVVLSVVFLTFTAILFVDLYGGAREIAGQTGGFGWERTVSRLPNWVDIFYIERFNWLYTNVFWFYDVDPSNYQKLNDLSTGFTPILLASFLFLAVLLSRKTLNEEQLTSTTTYPCYVSTRRYHLLGALV